MLAENLEGPAEGQGPSPRKRAGRLTPCGAADRLQMGKGRSVPDADLLIRLAEELDTTSAALLGPGGPARAERGGQRSQLAHQRAAGGETAGPGGSGGS